MDDLVRYLIDNDLTICTCESLTAGLFASYIADIPGSSKVLKGGLITYQTNIKETLLKISSKLIRKYGVVSKEMANEMAIKSQIILDSNIAISFTGNAGPTCMEGKEAGLVYISVKYNDELYSYDFNMNGNRQQVRMRCVEEGVNVLKKILGI